MNNDYSWYFGECGYSFDCSTGKQENSSTSWPCSGNDHIFPDTGMKKSWCRWCGEEGEFSIITGNYVKKERK